MNIPASNPRIILVKGKVIKKELSFNNIGLSITKPGLKIEIIDKKTKNEIMHHIIQILLLLTSLLAVIFLIISGIK